MGIIKHLALGIIGIVFVASLIGIAAAQEPTDKEYKLEAFSVTLPTNVVWRRIKSEPNQLEIGHSLGNSIYTFTLSAREYPLLPEPVASVSDLLVYIRNAAEKETKAKGRYQMTSHSETITNRLGFECVEFQKSWIDHGAAIIKDKELVMLANGLICIHPESAYRLIEISYSSRNNSGTVPLEIKNEGESFVNSLRAENLGKL